MQCFKNAALVSGISLLDRAFHYGDGCFTTAKMKNGHIELEQRHLQRLEWSCEKLKLNADLSLIQQTISLLKSEHDDLNGTLKIILSRGEGQRGYSLPEHQADVWVIYYPAKVLAVSYALIQGGVAEQRLGYSMPNLVGLKSLNRLEQVMLKHEADQKKWDEALVLDIKGTIVEGVSSNCFIRINNQWISPELGYNGVHGVMRAEILARMQACGVHCEQRDIHHHDIKQIQSLFFCNALSPMKIMTRLDDHLLETQSCIDLFHLLQLSHIQ